MWNTGRIGTLVMLNGITPGEWLWTTAIHVRPRLVDLAVDEALEEHAAAALVDGIAIEIELHDVGGGDVRRRHRARHQVAVRIGRVADADMAKGVEHALIGQNAVRRDEIVDQCGIDRAARGGRLGRGEVGAGHEP